MPSDVDLDMEGFLERLSGLVQGGGPSLTDRMADLSRMQRERFAAGEAGPAMPGSAEAALGLDVAGNFDLTGRLGPAKSVIRDWRWLPEAEVKARVGVEAVPEHVEKFGDYMAGMASKAKSQDLTARDLIKAFTITRSSIQRQAMDAAKLRERWPDFPGPSEGKIRPEGAFSEWLLTPVGKRYLDAAERGEVDAEAIQDVTSKLAGFGKTNDYIDAMTTAAILPGQEGVVGSMVAKAFDKPGKGFGEWRNFTKSLRGIGPAKSGFLASMLGRGDQPTLDARQIALQTGKSSAEARPYLARSSGLGATQAVDRLARRQEAMGLGLRPDLEPFRQHLTHHTLWDAAGQQQTTHEDLIRAMRLAGIGALGLPLLSQDERP